MVKQQHQLFVALLCVVDGLVAAAACFAAWALREALEPWWPPTWEGWVKGALVVFVVPIVLVSMSLCGLYRPRRDRSIRAEQIELLRVSVAAVAALIVVLWAVGNKAIAGSQSQPPLTVLGYVVDGNKFQLVALALALPLFLGFHRASFRLSLRVLRRRGRNLRHVAIIGVGRLGQIVLHTINRNTWTGINVAYFISHHPQTRRAHCADLPIMGALDDLEETLEKHPVDAVYLAIPNAQAAAVPKILETLSRFAVDVRIIPDVQVRFVPQSMAISELDGMPILSYRECPSAGLGGVTKRAVDIVGSLAAMAVFFPLFLLIAAVIRYSSPGPVIFKQRRVSLGGRRFKIYKFRTMYHVQDEINRLSSRKEAWTTRDDPRITPVGRWLRRTSLDELPQLLNVLKGQMSLVGPRPERPELIARFREDWRGYMLRQHVKAGMTGWAQVNGLRGNTSLKKRLQYDLFYVRHWSLWFDLRILWLTVFRGFVHRNAH